MTLKDTPNIVTASGIAGLDFNDEVQTANALVPQLEAEGVKAIVVLHPPGRRARAHRQHRPHLSGLENKYDSACPTGTSTGLNVPASPIIPIAQQLSPADRHDRHRHTHTPYVCSIPDPAGQPRLVTSASSFGRLVTETTLTYDRRTQDIVRSSVARQQRHRDPRRGVQGRGPDPAHRRLQDGHRPDREQGPGHDQRRHHDGSQRRR